jgi:hypothetical protein
MRCAFVSVAESGGRGAGRSIFVVLPSRDKYLYNFRLARKSFIYAKIHAKGGER